MSRGLCSLWQTVVGEVYESLKVEDGVRDLLRVR